MAMARPPSPPPPPLPPRAVLLTVLLAVLLPPVALALPKSENAAAAPPAPLVGVLVWVLRTAPPLTPAPPLACVGSVPRLRAAPPSPPPPPLPPRAVLLTVLLAVLLPPVALPRSEYAAPPAPLVGVLVWGLRTAPPLPPSPPLAFVWAMAIPAGTSVSAPVTAATLIPRRYVGCIRCSPLGLFELTVTISLLDYSLVRSVPPRF